MNIPELQSLVGRLNTLVQDPHAGLHTWNEAVDHLVQELMHKWDPDCHYTIIAKHDDDVYTIEDFRASVANFTFIDYDGFGNPARLVDGVIKIMPGYIVKPSKLDRIPPSATHVCWYNR